MTNEELFKSVQLFKKMPINIFFELLAEAVEVSVPSSTLVIKEGELADAFYIVKEGILEVFTIGRRKEEVLLASLETGDYVGEQALLDKEPGKRSANVRALTNCTLLKLTHQSFLKCIKCDETLQKGLKEIGFKQLFTKLKAIDSEYDISKYLFNNKDECQTKGFNPGEIIFNQGDLPDGVYLVLSGTVDVYRKNESGDEVLISSMSSNSRFGEGDIILNHPRQTTVKAHDLVTCFFITTSQFKELYGRSIELKAVVDTLSRVYQTTHRGEVTQYIGQFLQMPAIINRFKLKEGRMIVAARVVGKDIQTISVSNVKHQVSYVYEEKAIYRELVLSEGILVGVTVYGEWNALKELFSRVFEMQGLTEEELSIFKEKGELKFPKVTGDVVCSCIYVTKDNLDIAKMQGCIKVKSLSDACGAGTVCRACLRNISEILEEKR